MPPDLMKLDYFLEFDSERYRIEDFNGAKLELFWNEPEHTQLRGLFEPTTITIPFDSAKINESFGDIAIQDLELRRLIHNRFIQKYQRIHMDIDRATWKIRQLRTDLGIDVSDSGQLIVKEPTIRGKALINQEKRKRWKN